MTELQQHLAAVTAERNAWVAGNADQLSAYYQQLAGYDAQIKLIQRLMPQDGVTDADGAEPAQNGQETATEPA